MSAVPQTPGGADPAQLRWLPLGAAISAISVVGIAIGLGDAATQRHPREPRPFRHDDRP